MRIAAIALSLFAALPAVAQSVLTCDGWQGQARNIVEPWEQNSRQFANGRIRVTLLDTIEPAAGAYYLHVLAPPHDVLGGRNCAIIGANADIGFAALHFANLAASYDPARGLTLRVPVEVHAPATDGIDPAILAVTINQATGEIAPVYEIP